MLQFPTLVRIRRSLERLSGKGLLSVVGHLIENEQSATIVNGIFRQLHFDGDRNTREFLNDLSNLCQNIETQEKNDNHDQQKTRITNKKDKTSHCQFVEIPDSLMNEIASYLNIEDIFSGWIHVNRRFMEIGINSNIELTEWNTKWISQVEGFPPRFSMKPLLWKVKNLTYNRNDSVNMVVLLDICQSQHVKTFKIGMLIVVLTV